MHIFLDLFFTFAKIGMFTFGGGYAMIALIEKTCVEDKKWIFASMDKINVNTFGNRKKFESMVESL